MKGINLLWGKRDADCKRTRFSRTLGGQSVEVLPSEGRAEEVITLVPMKTLSLEEFSYPFTNAAKIRTALQLQAQPYRAGGEVELFPVVIGHQGRSSEGIVWYASSGELDDGASSKTKHWPAPLPFVSGLSDYGGSGITMWLDEENVCSLLWQSFRPKLYRWRRRSETAEESEVSWYDEYCSARSLERGGTFIIDITNGIGQQEEEQFRRIIADSLKFCPWISGLDISRKVLEGERDMARLIGQLTRVSIWLLVLGLVSLGVNIFRYYWVSSRLDEVRARSSALYREVFDPTRSGNISNPVSAARDKLASLTTAQDSVHTLQNVLEALGEIFRETQSMDITLDVIRYNSEGIDCTGTAPDMTTVLNFRNAWEQRAARAQVDNTQFVSGIGYRFDVRVRWQ